MKSVYDTSFKEQEAQIKRFDFCIKMRELGEKVHFLYLHAAFQDCTVPKHSHRHQQL